MSDGFPFTLQLGDGAAPIVAAARRRPRPAGDDAASRFRYPPFASPATPEPPPAAAPEPPAPPPPTFSEEELERAVETARREAGAAAEARVRTEMLASLEHRQADALSAIGERLAAGQEALERMLAARAAASRDLALAVALALVARALARQPLADVEAMFREVLVRLEGMPWLELRLPPSLVDAGQAALARAAEEAGYRGELRVIPDARLGLGDARLAWQDGIAERDLAGLEAEVTALVDAWLPATADSGPVNPVPEEPRPASLDDSGMDGFE